MTDNRPIEIRDGIEWYADEDGGLVWPSRLLAKREDLLAADIASLRQLQAETDPARGAATEFEKDLKAQQALSLAGNVVHHLAGWAIDHLAGLAKNNLDPQPYEREEMRVDDYAAARKLRDQHKYEREGNREHLTLDRDQLRRLLINFMSYNFGAFPEGPQCDVLEAFFAISRGDDDDLFRRAENGSRYNVERVTLQLQILSVIEYRKVLNGTSKEFSMDEIVGLFQNEGSGTKISGVDAIKKWEGRLRKAHGDKTVDQYIRHGRLMAAKVKAARAAKAEGRLAHDETAYSGELNDDALRGYVERYSSLPRK